MGVAIGAVPLTCYDHPTRESSVARYPEIFCGSSKHGSMQAFGILLLVLAGCFYGLTLYLAFIMPRKFASGELFWYEGGRWLFEKFNVNTWWYGCVQLLRNLLLSLVPAMSPNSSHVQILLVVTILAVGTGVQLAWQPWRAPLLNFSDAFLNIFLIVALVSAVPFLPKLDSADTERFAWAIFGEFIAGYVVMGMISVVAIFSIVMKGPRGQVHAIFNFSPAAKPSDLSVVLRNTGQDLVDSKALTKVAESLSHYEIEALAQVLDVFVSHTILREHGDGELKLAQHLKTTSLRITQNSAVDDDLEAHRTRVSESSSQDVMLPRINFGEQKANQKDTSASEEQTENGRQHDSQSQPENVSV